MKICLIISLVSSVSESNYSTVDLINQWHIKKGQICLCQVGGYPYCANVLTEHLTTMKFLLLTFCLLCLQKMGWSQEAELVVQTGHSGWIQDYAVSPDNKYMATASVDNTVKLWNLRSKKEVRTFTGHKNTVSRVIFSHDNTKIASGDDDGNVFLWDIGTGSLLDTFQHITKIIALAFSEDDSRLASFGLYKYFRVRDIRSRQVLISYRMWEQGTKLAFMPGDKNIITYIANDSTFNRYDIEGDSALNYLNYARGPVTDFTLSKDGRYVISIINADSSIRVYDLKASQSYKKINCLPPYPGRVVRGGDDSTIFTSSNFMSNDTAFIQFKKWNFHSGKCLDSTTVVTEASYIPRLVYASSTSELIFQYRESLLATVATEPLQFKEVLKKHGTLVNIVLEKEPGKFLLIAEDGPIKELNSVNNSYRILFPTTSHGAIRQLIPLQDSLFALVNFGNDTVLYKLNLQTFEPQPLIKDSHNIRNFKISPDKKRVVYYATEASNKRFLNNSQLVVKDISKDSILFKKQFNTYLLYNYNLLRGGVLAYQEKYDTITLVNIDDGKGRELFDSAYKYCSATFFVMLDSSRLFVSTQNGKFFIWDIHTGKLLKWISAHGTAFIYKIEFNSDSSQFISFADEVVKIWDTKTISLQQSFKGHKSWVSQGGYMAGEKEIYTSSGDQTFRIWTVATGKEKASFMMVDTADLVTRLPNKMYAATKQGMKYFSYRMNNELYPFEQFDLQYNRPHEVLKALGSTDTVQINNFYKAYTRRLKRSGFKEADFSADIHLPETSVEQQEELPPVSKLGKVSISFKVSDSKYLLDRYFVSVNNVPVNGLNGTSIKQLSKKSFQVTIPITLSVGKNKIQFSCMNQKGVESLRKDLYTSYEPVKKPESKVYFIGVGVSIYKDSIHNLTFADKDTRDLAKIFKQKYPGASIDTLLNEKATAANIMALKEKLEKTAINDIVIISVSSHGLLDEEQNYFIGTYDVNFKDPSVNGLKYEDLESLLDDIPARKKLLLIDACHSGEIDKEEEVARDFPGNAPDLDSAGLMAAARGNKLLKRETAARYKNSLEMMNELFADVTRNNGALIISAAGSREYALEDAKWGNGVFTFSVKKALLEGLADSNGDGVSVSELRNYVSEQVYILTGGRQRPTTRKENIEFDWKIW
jgi:WD40 repeat protein